MAVSALAFIAYPVTDLPRAIAFYQDVLGLPKAGRESPVWVEFDIAGTAFGVGTFEQLGVPGQAHALALEIADLPAFRTQLDARGVASTPPFETPVCFISTITDPDGNKIHLHQAKAT